MDNISRKDIDTIIKILKQFSSDNLADKLEKADIIPNLMIATYVKAVNRAISSVEVKQNDESDGQTITGLSNESSALNLEHINFSKSKLEAVKVMFEYAEERKGMICDFDDSKHPRTIIGRCQYENHYDDIDVNNLLTEDEQKIFEQLNDSENWFVACEKFKDKLNPDNQELTITLNINDDQKKYDDGEPEYVCKTCLEVISEDCDFYASCDMGN